MLIACLTIGSYIAFYIMCYKDYLLCSSCIGVLVLLCFCFAPPLSYGTDVDHLFTTFRSATDALSCLGLKLQSVAGIPATLWCGLEKMPCTEHCSCEILCLRFMRVGLCVAVCALGSNYTAELIGVQETPKPASSLNVDFSSILGPLFFTWAIQMLMPI